MRLHHSLTASLGLLATAGLVCAEQPGRLQLQPKPTAQVSANQHQADTIARQLRSSGQLQGYRIDITFSAGTAILEGYVAHSNQRDEATRLVQGVPGVERVLNRLAIHNAASVRAAEYPMMAQEHIDVMPQRDEGPAGYAGDPVPSYHVGMPGGQGANMKPPMPNYAWPTFAPYNNYSRVAYPKAYPHDAFPYIGPVHPFPKAPLGWRSVKLQFDDGHWWLSTHAQRRDWWHLRYW